MASRPSAPWIAISALALQASFRTPCRVGAEEAPSAASGLRPRSGPGHLRRQLLPGGESELGRASRAQDGQGGRDEIGLSQQQRRESLRRVLESLGAEFLQERAPLPMDPSPGQTSPSSSLSVNYDGPSVSGGMTGGIGSNEEGCVGGQWYPDINNPAVACTNAHPSSSSWSSDPSIIEAVQFDSSQSCCDALVDVLGNERGECLAIDECRASRTTTTAASRRRLSCADSLGFHPDVEKQAGCTNNSNYPDPWLRPGLKEKMFYPTAKACCDWFFSQDGCPVTDVCEGAPPPQPTPPKKKPTPPAPVPAQRPTPPAQPSGGGGSDCMWHVDLVKQDGCTNDLNFPPSWDDPNVRKNMMQPTAKQCCERMFPNKPCKHYDNACAPPPPPPTPPPTPARPKPTRQPSKRPTTPQPSKRPTRSPVTRLPTRRPTPPPTSEPTPKPIEYFVDDMSGMCFSDREKETPHWISVTYRSYDQCCFNGSTDEQKCLQNRPDEPGGRAGPWYVSETSGMCIHEGERRRPARVEETYAEYEQCCEESSNRELCLKARPSNGAGRGAGPLPPGLVRLWYVSETSGLCIHESERRRPDWIKEAYARYEQCCQESSDKELCMKARPSNGGQYGTLAPTPTPPATYFVDQTTGMCTSDLEKPIPNFATAIFEDFNRCCILESNDPEKCLDNEPFSNLGSKEEPTPAPVPVYYLLDSTGLCVNEKDTPMPYPVQQTYDSYELCCKYSGTWKKDECLEKKPTMFPSKEPTWSPSTPWPTETAFCPKPYDPSGSVIYRSDHEVESGWAVYRCKPPPNAAYCNNPKFRPPEEDPGPAPKRGNNGIPVANIGGGGGNKLWEDAWERLYMCVESPSASPTRAPNTPSPTCKTRWHPGAIGKKICTNSANYPVIWNEDSILRVAYFADSADECCEKFYGGKKCRIRDEC